jgi:hypothetical protein
VVSRGEFGFVYSFNSRGMRLLSLVWLVTKSTIVIAMICDCCCELWLWMLLWLVVSNIFYFPFSIWNNPSHWLSYFWRWLKPPTSTYDYNYCRTIPFIFIKDRHPCPSQETARTPQHQAWFVWGTSGGLPLSFHDWKYSDPEDHMAFKQLVNWALYGLSLLGHPSKRWEKPITKSREEQHCINMDLPLKDGRTMSSQARNCPWQAIYGLPLESWQ